MPANVQPIFPVTPVDSWITTPLTGANTAKDGTGAVSTLMTAGANGTRVDTLSLRPLGTNVASVLRIFINNGQANSTPANNSLFFEVSLPITTLTEGAAQTALFVQFDAINNPQLVLPAGYKLNLALGTAVAAGWQATAIGGNY